MYVQKKVAVTHQILIKLNTNGSLDQPISVFHHYLKSPDEKGYFGRLVSTCPVQFQRLVDIQSQVHICTV